MGLNAEAACCDYANDCCDPNCFAHGVSPFVYLFGKTSVGRVRRRPIGVALQFYSALMNALQGRDNIFTSRE